MVMDMIAEVLDMHPEGKILSLKMHDDAGFIAVSFELDLSQIEEDDKFVTEEDELYNEFDGEDEGEE